MLQIIYGWKGIPRHDEAQTFRYVHLPDERHDNQYEHWLGEDNKVTIGVCLTRTWTLSRRAPSPPSMRSRSWNTAPPSTSVRFVGTSQ